MATESTAQKCPRCGGPMTKSEFAKRYWPEGDRYLTCDRITCPCFITTDDGVVHFGGST